MAQSPPAAAPLDSDRLFELEDRVSREASWLIYLSLLTVIAGFAIGTQLVVEGVVYLLLSIILKLKQSRAAALALVVAALASTVVVILSMATGGQADIPIGFASPAVALSAAVIAAVNAFRLQRMLEIPLAPNRGDRRDG